MNVYNISKKEFKNLIPFETTSVSTESELFIFNKHHKWNTEKSLFKKFYVTEGEYFGNKLYTINNLLDLKNNNNINELVFPSSIISVGNQIQGFSLPIIEDATAFSIIQNDSNIDLKDKLNILKNYMKVLDKVHKQPNFFIGDIHEDNFLVNNNGDIKIIDLDSCKIGNNNPFAAKYLNTNRNIEKMTQKYSLFNDSIYNQNINTDIFCYIIMLLNTISGININKLSLDEFYEYLNYLSSIGYDTEVLKQFSTIYTNEQNNFDINSFKYIPTSYQSSYKVFKYIKNKK